ncbi:MAG: hypothetical protein ABIQ70_10910 [Dokdonella sp.]
MQTDRPTSYWPYIAGVALVALVSWLFYFRSASGDRPAQPASSPVEGATNPNDAVKSIDESARNLGAGSSPSRAVSYEHADNLLAIVQAGEGKTDRVSLELRARALHECRTLGATPNEFDNLETKGPALYGDKLPTAKSFVATYLKRCGDLARMGKADSAQTDAAIDEAAKAGSVWAKAVLFPKESVVIPGLTADANFGKLLASRDAAAIGVIAEQMERQRTDSKFSDLAGSPLATYAWQLASCEFGRDCTLSGQLMRDACLFDGLCGTAADFHALLKDSVLSADELERVEIVERSVVEAIRTGVH